MARRNERRHRARWIAPAAGLTLVETLVTFVLLGFLSTLILQAVGFFAARYEGVQRVHRVAALESLQQNWFATSVQGFIPYGVEARRFVGHPNYFEGITLEPLNAQPGTPVTVTWFIDAAAVHYAESLAPTVPGIQWTVRHSDTSARPPDPRQPDTREIGLNSDISARSRIDPRERDTREIGLNSDIGARSRFEPPVDPRAPLGDLAFHYADAFASWYDHWPPRRDAEPLAVAGSASTETETQTLEDLIDALANTVTVAPDDPLSDPTNDWTPRLIRLFSAAEGTIWIARVEPSARPLLTDASLE